ncbi:acetyl-CoA synthetase-like protein [Pseudovirgaria hyperparasitica]|uniref:Acetyl-CoA synthetase-like protein n=1 Tax=Pseudovirgaria hyperparasitica TaxID=470096 RepID=A0A6A6W988_9PEZI|nr:acetyl-CoA synthetase-like protein [Pseudovirgaria hyperparasitica]KAF2758584.1 acetyl-CoA synthetase-like protein [Pseudovirgaria hyperparasitica]
MGLTAPPPNIGLSELLSDGSPRLLVPRIDYIATREPNKVYATIPHDTEDLSQGFQDITYSAFARAIDHAAWWLNSALKTANVRFQTVSYWGPFDLQYVIMIVACMKIRCKILLLSCYASFDGIVNLFDKVGCQCLLLRGTLPTDSNIAAVLRTRLDVCQVPVPPSENWLSVPAGLPYPYNETYASSAGRVACILHSSGTTCMVLAPIFALLGRLPSAALPKPIYYTNRRLAAFGAARFLSQKSPQTRAPRYAGKRLHTHFFPCHTWGLALALFHPVYDDAQPIIALPKGGVDVSYAKSILKHCQIQTIAYVSGLLESMIRDPEALSLLRGLEQIKTGGCPLGVDLIRTLERDGGTDICEVYGSTEIYPMVCSHLFDDAAGEHSYFAFGKCMGLDFEEHGDGLFEMKMKKVAGLEQFQGVFDTYPHLETFHTGDLFVPHPDRAGYWRIVGRVDDVISLSNGQNMVVALLERQIAHHELVSGVYIGQSGRPWPIVLLEPNEKAFQLSDEDFMNSVWMQIQKANEGSKTSVQLCHEHLFSTGLKRRLPRTAKLAIDRAKTAAEFKDLFDRAYGFSL